MRQELEAEAPAVTLTTIAAVTAACMASTAAFTASAAHADSEISFARRFSAFSSTASVTILGTTLSAFSSAISDPIR